LLFDLITQDGYRMHNRRHWMP